MINKKQMWSDSLFNQWTEEELLCMKYQGICYGKGGGSAPPPPPATQTVRQSSEFPEELKPFIGDIFGKAQAIQEQRQEEGFRPELTQQLASFTPDQQASFAGIREQVGQTRPLFEEATNLARGATRAATDPAEVAALMNPFLRNVTDIEKREAQRVADVQEQQLAAQAAQAGAFGGSRAAILEAERQRNLAQQLGDIEARGRLAAFQDAQNRLQNQFGREAAGAAQLSALGAAIPAQTFKELGALSGVGAAEQQQTQRALDIATQQAREEYGFPMQTLQDFQSILRGFPLPATTNVSKQTFSPAQPLSTQLLGLGTGLAGLAGAAGAFKKAGGLVGAPVAMKNGGYVKLAGGGGLGQLMQGKLPSNRVRMGKVAYQDASTRTLREILENPQKGDPSRNEIIKLVMEQTSHIQDAVKRNQANEILLDETLSEIISFSKPVKQPSSSVRYVPPPLREEDKVAGPAQTATKAIQTAADTTTTPKVPTPAPEAANNLQRSVALQKAQPSLFQRPTYSQTQPPLQTQPPFTPLSPKTEDFLREIEYQDYLTDIQQELVDKVNEKGELTSLAAPPLVSTSQTQPPFTPLSPEMEASLRAMESRQDRTDREQEIADIGQLTQAGFNQYMANRGQEARQPATTLQGGPASSGLTPSNVAAAVPTLSATSPLNPANINTNNLLSTMAKPVDNLVQQPAIETESTVAGEMEGASNFIPLPDAKNTNMFDATKNFSVGLDQSQVNRRPPLPEKSSTFGLGPDASQFSSDLRGVIDTVEANRQRMLAQAEGKPYKGKFFTPMMDYFFKSKEDVAKEAEEFNQKMKAYNQRLAAAKGEKADSINPLTAFGGKAVLPEDVAAKDTTTTTDPAAAETPPAKAPAGTAADPLTGPFLDEEVDKGRPSPGATPAQVDYNAQISDIKNRDYSDRVNKMLGDAPTYEKGEEPDFAGRMYLALANAGFALAAAPGTDSFGKAFGDAARVGIKDLTSIFKEKRKVEKELRQERNAQKRADYQDKLQRFNLSEKLRGNDLNMLKTVADIEAKKKSNEISAENAEANMMRAVAQSARADGQELRDALKDKRDEAGNIRWGDVQARLDLAKKFANKAMSDFLKGGVGYDKERASEIYTLSYNKQKALLAQEIYGTVLINGKPISNAEVDRRLGIDKLTAPEGKSKPTVDGGSYRVKSSR